MISDQFKMSTHQVSMKSGNSKYTGDPSFSCEGNRPFYVYDNVWEGSPIGPLSKPSCIL